MNRSRSWVCYDAECPLCIRWVSRFRVALEKNGFALLPLQSPDVRAALNLPETALMAEMRVITPQGLVFGGMDALVYLSSVLCKPVFWLTRLPGVMPLLRRAYRYVARNRGCAGNTCRITPNPTLATVPNAGTTSPSPIRWEMARVRVARNKPRIEPMDQKCRDSASLSSLKEERAGERSLRVQGEIHSVFGIRRSMLGVPRFIRRLWVVLKNAADWLPLLMLCLAAAIFGLQLPPWLYMWVLAFALFIGCKWLCFRRAFAGGANATLGRKLGFLFGWIGMDAREFFAKPAPATTPRVREFVFATLKILLGAVLLWKVTPRALSLNPLLAGWTGMVGLIFFLHFGFFHLLSLAWRAAGVNAPPLMRAPLLSHSLSEFWGKRWNTAFHHLVAKFLFRPLNRKFGALVATLFVFLASGLVHDLVISIPARGGYGLPTLYFLLQGAGVLFERTRLGRRLGIDCGFRGWLFTVLFTAGPVFCLFHPPFIHNVILPFLKCLGAI